MTWKTVALVAAFAVGCGKKKEPESAAGPMIETGIGLVDVNIHSNPQGNDERAMNAPVTIKNNLGGPITVNKIEWAMNVGTQDIGKNSKTFDEQVAAGATGKFLLTNKFSWSDERPLVDDMATVTGTITWTGPKGNVNTTELNVSGKIKSEPEIKIIDKDGEGQ